ncbi:PPOX class F420-dependent oxidoreductase [Pseudokineococcus basanitobsidens]|uniref:PPOX class F420-dependent oxidoreductase n=1 Tax=Pseudokineococcus basanitobsidens TaxID=1926649 RepID=A0ABU8RKT9_9ACTN
MTDDSARTLESLGAQTYVSLVTYRADGSERPTPVWLVRDGDVLRVTTGATSAKVRRARRDPRATVTPCDARGRLEDGAATTSVAVEVSDDAAEVRRTNELLRRKHPVAHRLVSAAHAVAERVPGRSGGGAQVTLLLRPLPAHR